MTREEYIKEIHYQSTMKQAEKLLENKLINIEEYQKFKEKMLKKYEPKISQLIDISVDK